MKQKMLLSVLALVALSMVGTAVYAKTFTVKELNSGPDGTFVFDPNFLHLQPGDSVHFVASDAGHDSMSYFVPPGAKNWKSEVSTDITVTFSKDGVYLYECSPHHMFGMLGVIEVGKATHADKEAAEKAAKGMEAQQIMNKGRLEKLMSDIK
ncbi:MAG: plastocyanin/azurin family copper-binding protein [Gammaproteobacteria bacterium]